MKPCKHENTEPNCRICWLAENVKEVQRKWNLPETGMYATLAESRKQRLVDNLPKGIKKVELPCIHEGAILEFCPTCNGEMRHVRDCDIYEKCTRGFVSSNMQSCVRCKDYVADTTVQPKKEESIKDKNVSDNTVNARNRVLATRRENAKAKIAATVEKETREIVKDKPIVEEKEGKVTVTRMPYSSSIIRLKTGSKETIEWVCAVTTVPSRKKLLERTLDSIHNAGFVQPRIFIDIQDSEKQSVADTYIDYSRNLTNDITIRTPNIRTFGNWFLALTEMYIRHPYAHRYAFFQDDIVFCKNVRQYLDCVEYIDNSYLNLITYPQNEAEKRKYFDKSIPEKEMTGWYKSNGIGKGAQALVFNRQTLYEIITSEYLLNRPRDLLKGHQNIDGGLAIAMKQKRITEYVHSPSLVRHTGDVTTIFTAHPTDPKINIHPDSQPVDLSFRGEDWDVMQLLGKH